MSEISKEEGVIAETTMPPALSDAPKVKGKKAKVEREELPTVIIELPLGDAAGYASNRVDLTLRPHETAAMRRILNGLQSQSAKLNGRRPLCTNADVIRWLIEQVDAA